MTPRLDILLAAKPADVLSHLGAARCGGTNAAATLLRNDIQADGYALGGTPAPRDAPDGVIRKLGAIDHAKHLAIACDAAFEHARLAGVLNLCEQHGLPPPADGETPISGVQ